MNTQPEREFWQDFLDECGHATGCGDKHVINIEDIPAILSKHEKIVIVKTLEYIDKKLEQTENNHIIDRFRWTREFIKRLLSNHDYALKNDISGRPF